MICKSNTKYSLLIKLNFNKSVNYRFNININLAPVNFLYNF